MIRLMTMFAALLLPAAALAQSVPRAGDTYEVTGVREMVMQGEGSSGSTFDRWTIQERVIAVREDGIEFEYDHSEGTTAEERASDWQFPVRVFKPLKGPLQLLNAPELEARVDPWLKSGGMTRAICGHLIFTWNAFRIDCDPQSVLRIVAGYDLGGTDLHDGAPYSDPRARAPGVVRRSAGSQGAIFAVELAADPEVVRRERAETDMGVAEISGEKLTLDEALRKRSAETVSGTITIRFDVDSAGNVVRRTTVTKLESKGPDVMWETETTTETLERRRINGRR